MSRYHLDIIVIALLAIGCNGAKAKTALLECEQEWFDNGKWVSKHVSVQIDRNNHRLVVAGWSSASFGVWEERDGVIEFYDSGNKWWGNMDRRTGEGAIWGKGIAHHSFKCKPAKALQ
jgi:hypothetical protein